jgi:phosphatidylserine decarboxylase
MFAPEGWPFILGGAAFSAVAGLVWPRWMPLAAAGVLFTLFSLWFFRSPDRTPPAGDGLVVSPADGKVVYCGDAPPGRYAAAAGKRVSVFMSPLDVHVNRAPVTGRVASVKYNPGKFHAANVEKASLLNEQNGVEIVTAGGRSVTYVQIAGGTARRSGCAVKAGDEARIGQRVGMIRFGSRLDVYFPPDAQLRVALGDRVRAGETVLGVLR